MNCLNCGVPLESVWSRKFCSTECRLKYWRKNNPEKVDAQRSRDRESGGSANRAIKRYHEKLKSDPRELERQRQKAKLRKKKLRSLPRNFTVADWKVALEFFNHRCAYCGVPLTKAEQDHFVPVKLGGGYTRSNIVPACSSCNSKKRAKNPLDWLVTQAHGLVAYVRIKNFLEQVT